MADLTRKTANLFDKDNTTIYNAYFSIDSESSIWITNADSRSVKISCKPNTQYTLSISSAIPIFRICSSSNANIEPSGGGVRVRTIIRSENIQQYTFTTSADDVCILFQGSASLVNERFNSLMLNEGGTPLPYEPYGWVHSLRKLGTSTDTITSLPADIYADGNNATVGLVGNMSQSGTPSPTTPIQPQECGERTENLFDKTTAVIGERVYVDRVAADAAWAHSDFIDISGADFITVSQRASITTFYFYADKTDQSISYYQGDTAEVPNNAKYVRINMSVSDVNSNMLVIGSIAPTSYIPYGYKLDISSGGKNLLASLTENYAIDASGNINSNSSFMYYTAPCEANKTYTFSLDSGLSGNNVRIHAFNGDTWIEQLSGRNINLAPFTVTTPANTTNLKISITKDAIGYHTMLNEGSTPLPYEPYNRTTTPVYLGEVETTRLVKKLVLTGEEAFIKNDSQSNHYLYYANRGTILPSSIVRTPVLCNELPTKDEAPQTVIGINTDNQFNVLYFNFGADVMNAQPSGNTVAGLKEYLAAQYAAGTPVTIWYVLATAETGIVNEPLRKIGDYVDTVSGITIPTITGKDTLDVETTLKPSEVELTYMGWHDASVKEKSRNLFDLASWIIANGSTYTKDGESYTFDTKQSMFSTPFYFSNTDIDVSISGIIESITAPSPRLHLLHANGTSAKSGALTPSTLKSENISCAGLKLDWSSTGGEVKISNLMLNTGSTALPYEPYWK